MKMAAGLPAASGSFDPFAGITQIRSSGRPSSVGTSQPGRPPMWQIPSSRTSRMYSQASSSEERCQEAECSPVGQASACRKHNSVPNAARPLSVRLQPAMQHLARLATDTYTGGTVTDVCEQDGGLPWWVTDDALGLSNYSISYSPGSALWCLLRLERRHGHFQGRC